MSSIVNSLMKTFKEKAKKRELAGAASCGSRYRREEAIMPFIKKTFRRVPHYKAEFDGGYYCRNGFFYEHQKIYWRSSSFSPIFFYRGFNCASRILHG